VWVGQSCRAAAEPKRRRYLNFRYWPKVAIFDFGEDVALFNKAGSQWLFPNRLPLLSWEFDDFSLDKQTSEGALIGVRYQF
jgi:hypothetical protein